MELIAKPLAQILSIIQENFFQLLIIASMMKHKHLKGFGILLLFSHLFFGYKWYIYAIALIIVCYIGGADE